ncbi:MAG TPA: plastocyanin/azurin family copper-binding protein [Gemmatimonadaceae bacterium]
MRKTFTLAAVLALVGCSGSGYGGSTYGGVTGPPQDPGPPVMTTSVSLRNIAFNPGRIQVAPGATVEFTNNDGITHNITFSSNAITGATDFATGSRAVVMPTTPGTYAYHCTIHAGMAGTVTVQ